MTVLNYPIFLLYKIIYDLVCVLCAFPFSTIYTFLLQGLIAQFHLLMLLLLFFAAFVVTFILAIWQASLFSISFYACVKNYVAMYTRS